MQLGKKLRTAEQEEQPLTLHKRGEIDTYQNKVHLNLSVTTEDGLEKLGGLSFRLTAVLKQEMGASKEYLLIGESMDKNIVSREYNGVKHVCAIYTPRRITFLHNLPGEGHLLVWVKQGTELEEKKFYVLKKGADMIEGFDKLMREKMRRERETLSYLTQQKSS